MAAAGDGERTTTPGTGENFDFHFHLGGKDDPVHWALPTGGGHRGKVLLTGCLARQL